MKKLFIVGSVAALSLGAYAAGETKVGGFAQITAEDTREDGKSFAYGADRIRMKVSHKQGKGHGALQVDFLQNADGTSAVGVNEIIKDAYWGYKAHKMANVKAGVFKTPVGMDFNTSGAGLDITKRGMEKGLVLERAAGLMISGDLGHGVSYAIGNFNPTQRSSAVDDGAPGTESAMAYRVSYDRNDFHFEISKGSQKAVEPAAGQTTTDIDFEVMGLAASYKMNAFTFKAEYLSAEGVKFTKGHEETVWYAHVGYRINDSMEAVVRHYAGTNTADDAAATKETELTNTYIGLNYWAEKNYRVQLNYVIAGGDTDATPTKAAYTGLRGTKKNQILGQFQVKF